jgi:aspartate/methionine/tyrosine aminotransferase
MERWQSTYEHRVRFNLSESGVHPMALNELLAIAGEAPEALGPVRFGYGQSNGSDELRERIAALYPDADPSNVLVTVGGAEANFACCWHLVEPGDAAAVMIPNYMQVPGLIENFRARPLPFRLTEETGWEADLDELDRALDAGARFILITNPNNPTGKVFREEALDAIVRRADRVGAWILSDEVYQGAEAGGDPTPTLWGRYERVLVTNSLSKAYGLPGLRIGWALGPTDVVERLWARTDYTTITPATLSDRLATLALEPGTRRKILDRTRDIVRENLAATRDWLDARPELFAYHPPDAGAIVYTRYSPAVSSSWFAELLRTQKDVLVVPGDHFGMDRYLRIGFGPPLDELMEALGRVAEAFAEVKAGAH